MDFTVEKAALEKELDWVQAFVEGRSTIPIIENVLINADKKTVSLTATNLDVIGTTRFSPISVAEPGAITVFAQSLLMLLKRLPDTNIRLQSTPEGLDLKLTAQGEVVTLVALAADIFPKFPDLKLDYSGDVSSKVLGAMIRGVRFAIAERASRYAINCALLMLKQTGVVMVTTEGAVSDVDKERRLLLRAEAMTHLQRLASEDRNATSIGADPAALVAMLKANPGEGSSSK
jgi:DNA polymerase III subunit beta